MPGTRLFQYANIAPEATRGTPVPPTRQLYMDGSWNEDHGLHFHEGENRGIRTRSARVPTQTYEDVTFSLKDVDGTSYDDLSYAFAVLNGTATGTGAGADKTWIQTPSMTGSNSPKAFTLDLGDDTQNWRLQYCMWQNIKIASAKSGLTSLQLDGFAQRSIKGAKAVPATNAGVKIPGDLWTVKFATTAAGLVGAAVVTNFLLDWELDINSGAIWRHYMDGNLYGAQHVETDISFTLPKSDGQVGVQALKRIQSSVGFASLLYDDHIGKLSLVGAGMRSHPGISATLFQALADAGINIEMISTSEIRVSVITQGDQLDDAVRAVHTAFGLDSADGQAVVYGGTGR